LEDATKDQEGILVECERLNDCFKLVCDLTISTHRKVVPFNIINVHQEHLPNLHPRALKRDLLERQIRFENSDLKA